MKQKNTCIGFGCIGLSLFFFFNPDINVIDLLPDAIGYILLAIGLSKLADLNEKIQEAMLSFQKMIYVSLFKILAVFWLFGLTNNLERPVGFLVFSFSFATIELLLLIPAWAKLFDGLLYLGNRMNGVAVFEKKTYRGRAFAVPCPESADFTDVAVYERKLDHWRRRQRRFEKKERARAARFAKKKTAVERVRAFAIVFVSFKAFMAVLPEFASLSTSTYNETLRTGFLYEYVELFRALSCLIVLGVGIAWLVGTLRFWGRIKKDRSFVEACYRQYCEEVLPREELFIQRGVKRAFAVLSVGVILCLHFYVDNVNVFPDLLSAIALLVGVLMLRRYVEEWQGMAFLCGLYGVSALVYEICELRFYSVHTVGSIYRNQEAYDAFLTLNVIKGVNTVAFLLAMWALTRLLRQVTLRYTGFSMGEIGREKVKSVHKELNRKVSVVFVAACLCAAMETVHTAWLGRQGVFAEITWILALAASVILIITFFSAKRDIDEQMEYKYMLSR